MGLRGTNMGMNESPKLIVGCFSNKCIIIQFCVSWGFVILRKPFSEVYRGVQVRLLVRYILGTGQVKLCKEIVLEVHGKWEYMALKGVQLSCQGTFQVELKNLEMLLSGLSSSRPGSSRIKLNVKWGQQSKLMVDVNVKITLETFTRIRR